jgi:histidinol-phosphate/aromatic aminotransferase/cobyric acid decarboxylase-like protein
VRSRGSRVAVVCNPNNPDGSYLPRREVVRLMDALADLDLVVIDESFLDFVDEEGEASVAGEAMVRSNVLVLRSLGKNFGLHGVRFGYVVGNPALVRTVGSRLPKWNINSMAEAVVFMLKEHEAAYRESLRLLARDRYNMSTDLLRVPGLTVYPSQANFVLVKLPRGVDGARLRDYLLSRHGVLVRECGNKLGITSQFVRLVVRPRKDVDRLLEGLLSYLSPQRDEPARPQFDDASPLRKFEEPVRPFDEPRRGYDEPSRSPLDEPLRTLDEPLRASNEDNGSDLVVPFMSRAADRARAR